MKCPRCGAEMSGGICNSCGFPMNKRIIVTKKMSRIKCDKRGYYTKK